MLLAGAKRFLKVCDRAAKVELARILDDDVNMGRGFSTSLDDSADGGGSDGSDACSSGGGGRGSMVGGGNGGLHSAPLVIV